MRLSPLPLSRPCPLLLPNSSSPGPPSPCPLFLPPFLSGLWPLPTSIPLGGLTSYLPLSRLPSIWTSLSNPWHQDRPPSICPWPTPPPFTFLWAIFLLSVPRTSRIGSALSLQLRMPQWPA